MPVARRRAKVVRAADGDEVSEQPGEPMMTDGDMLREILRLMREEKRKKRMMEKTKAKTVEDAAAATVQAIHRGRATRLHKAERMGPSTP